MGATQKLNQIKSKTLIPKIENLKMAAVIAHNIVSINGSATYQSHFIRSNDCRRQSKNTGGKHNSIFRLLNKYGQSFQKDPFAVTILVAVAVVASPTQAQSKEKTITKNTVQKRTHFSTHSKFSSIFDPHVCLDAIPHEWRWKLTILNTFDMHISFVSFNLSSFKWTQNQMICSFPFVHFHSLDAF